jgi:putative SOS response-associated peptidase YedK
MAGAQRTGAARCYLGAMCGRFTLTTADLDGLARDLRAELDPAFRRPWRPRFNVAPGDAHVVLRDDAGRRLLREAGFGFTSRPGELTINARMESAAVKPTFRESWRSRRCAVPADGFYEWSGPRSNRRPSWLHRSDGRPLLFAALWRPAGAGIPEFAILTVDANADVRALHDRMPAVLAEGALDAWLEGQEPPRLAPEGTLAARAVSPRVNSVRNDDPECLAPPEGDPQLDLI